MQAESSRTRLDSKSTYFCSSRVKTFPGTFAMIYTIKCLCVDTYEHIFVRAQ